MIAPAEPVQPDKRIASGRQQPPETGQPATVYAIGDIHGCYGLLRDLLAAIVRDVERLPADQPVTCVFMGDYIDRGPDSAAVLSALVWLERKAPFDCVFLRGNHEQVMLDFIADPSANADWLKFGGIETLRSYGVTVGAEASTRQDHVALRDALLDCLPAAHLDFIGRLPCRYERDAHLFVHAGIRPGVPIADQADADLLWIRDEFLSFGGAFEKTVVHGHTWVSDEPEVTPGRIGIDTGAYQTGVLTAVRIQGSEIGFLTARDPHRSKEASHRISA